MNNRILFLFFALSFVSGLNAQKLEKAFKVLEQRGEVVLKFQKPVSQNLKDLSEIMSIDKIERHNDQLDVYAYMNKGQFRLFQDKNINFEILNSPSLKAGINMCPNLESVKTWTCYPTYEQYLATMQSFENDYPKLCKLYEFGNSVDNRKLLAVKISDNVTEKDAEPEFLYTSTMHGDETTGYVLMLRLIDYLLANYNTDPRIADLINNIEIWINPLSNPDGTYFTNNSTVSGATRFNSNSYDLNRNFPNPIDGAHSTFQKETIAMMDFLKSHHFTLAANFHGGSEVVNYPWDNWTSNERTHADDVWYKEISHEYADTVQANSTGYMIGFDDGITEGADWYMVDGGRQDYMNYFLRSREVTIEISNEKMPVSDLLPNFWKSNYRSFLNYINRVNKGIYGKITDESGKPLYANILIENHDFFNSEIYTDSVTGMYYRMIPQGNYMVKYFAEGYLPKKINVTVSSEMRLEQNVVLYRTGEVNIVKSINSPFADKLQIDMVLEKPENIGIKLYNLSGRIVLDYNLVGISGANQVNLETNKIPIGFYICRIFTESIVSTTKIVKLVK